MANQEKSIPEVFVALFSELPADRIVWSLTDGSKLTAGDMVRECEQKTELGQQYMSDALRVVRDLISRQARK